MSKVWHRALLGGTALGLAITAVAVLLIADGVSRDVAADSPHTGLEFSIGVDVDGDTVDDCNSATATTKCTLPGTGVTFDMRFYLDSNGGIEYAGYDAFFPVTGVVATTNWDHTPWPECAFNAADFSNPAQPGIACAAFSPPTSTYSGLMATMEFDCAASGSISIRHGMDEGGSWTGLTDNDGLFHGEQNGTADTLTINCGEAPTPTDTPAATPTPCPPEGCPTPTPTNTPPPTATPTNTPPPTPTPEFTQGDVDNNGIIDSRDALWVLWIDANLVPDSTVPSLDAADANKDGTINSLDALLILQHDAGLIEL